MVPQNFLAKPAPLNAAAPEPTIHFKGYYASDKAQKGRVMRAAIVLGPDGYHINADKPLGKYAIPTTVKIESPNGVTVGPIAFPRAMVQNSKRLTTNRWPSEGHAIMRFNVVPQLRRRLAVEAKVRYQSCNDDVCFPPEPGNRLWYQHRGRERAGAAANGQVFGGK
jgi:hypothetical protein